MLLPLLHEGGVAQTSFRVFHEVVARGQEVDDLKDFLGYSYTHLEASTLSFEGVQGLYTREAFAWG